MGDDSALEKELQRLRTQGKVEVIILVSSFVLVFLWMSYFSLSFHQPTFSGEVYEEFQRASMQPAGVVINLSLVFAIIFTCCFLGILRKVTGRLSRNE